MKWKRVVIGKAKHKVALMEHQYIKLAEKLLIGKVISFETGFRLYKRKISRKI
jgi:hypothetical protein